MIITKKALPRRTFLRGAWRDDCAAAAGCHGALDDGAGGHTCAIPCAAWGLSTCRWAPTSRSGLRRARAS